MLIFFLHSNKCFWKQILLQQFQLSLGESVGSVNPFSHQRTVMLTCLWGVLRVNTVYQHQLGKSYEL